MSGFDLSVMQKDYWNNSTHRWNIKTGATGSGKTYLDFYLLPKRIRACTGKGLIVLLGNTKTTLERNILDPMREIYGDYAVGSINNENVTYLFGRKTYCLGADKVNQVSKIQGATIEYAYGDEVTTWNREVFEMLKSRLRCENSMFDGTCNPDGPNHFFKKFLDSDADIYQQKYTIDDNPFLPQKFVEELKKEYSGTIYYEEDKQTLEDYKLSLTLAGLEEMQKSYSQVVNINVNTVDRGIKYLLDYDLGDKVEIVVEPLNTNLVTRIIEVNEVFKKGQHTVSLTFGTKVPRVYRKI